MDLIAAPCRTCSRIAVAKRRYLNLVRGVLKLELCARSLQSSKQRERQPGERDNLEPSDNPVPALPKRYPAGDNHRGGGAGPLSSPRRTMRRTCRHHAHHALRISRQGAEVTCEVPRLAHNFPHKILEVPRCTQFATCLPVGD